MKRKKLLIASDAFLPRWDGIARFLNEMIPLLEEEYDITVIAPNYGEPPRKYNVNLIRFEPIRMQFGDYYPSSVSQKIIYAEAKKADVVFVQDIGTIGTSTIFIANRIRKPIIYYSHLIDWEVVPKSIGKRYLKPVIYSGAKLIGKYLMNKCNLVLVPSLETLELFSWMKITSKKKIVHLGVNVNKFCPPQKKDAAKQRLGIDPRHYVVGYVGRLGYEKDLFTLQRAFYRLRSAFDDIRLLIVGGGRADIESLFRDKKNIIYAGPQMDPVPYYQAMDNFVLPSLEETTSLATLEAMSCGLPCITTEVGFVKEYIKEGKNGMFFPKKDTFTLSKKISMLKKSPELRQTLGRSARQTVIDQFSWDTTVREIKEAINSF